MLERIYALGWAKRLSDVGSSVRMLCRPTHLLLFADLPFLALAFGFVPRFGAGVVRRPARKVILAIASVVTLANIVVGSALPSRGLNAAAYRYGLANAQAIDVLGGAFRPKLSVDCQLSPSLYRRLKVTL